MVRIIDRAEMAADTAGNASHGGHSRDRTVASSENIAATASSDDTEYPNMKRRSKGHIPALARRARQRQAKRSM
jgi:hypothetical protein